MPQSPLLHMKTFTFPEIQVRELNRMSYTLFKFFSDAIQNQQSKEPEWNSANDIECVESPEKFYSFQAEHHKVYIHKNRVGTYSLEIYGYVPQRLRPSKEWTFNKGMYRQFYGDFKSLHEAKMAFADVVNQIISLSIGALF